MVKVLNIETSRTDCELSGGETMLEAIQGVQGLDSGSGQARRGVGWRRSP